MIEYYAFLSIPLASFLQFVSKQKTIGKTILIPIIFALTFLSGFHNIQYHYGAIHYDSMTRKAYFDSFLHTHHSQQFDSLLDPPDYESAKMGIR